MNIKAYLESGFSKQGLEINTQQVDQMVAMLDLLNEWNQRHNITRILGPEEQCIYLVFDATAALRQFQSAKAVLDVGTGGGFPGIPLAICLPHVTFHLNDINAKKMAYLRHLKGRLGLDNVILHHEDVTKLFIQELDIITARAVAQPDELYQLTKHLNHERLKYMLYVSEQTANEHEDTVIQLNVPGSDRDSYLLLKST